MRHAVVVGVLGFDEHADEVVACVLAPGRDDGSEHLDELHRPLAAPRG